MFRNTTPAAEPAHDNDVASANLTIPLSVLELDLSAPVGGWEPFLTVRNIVVVVDDVGRKAVSRDDARTLIAEQHENEAHAREMAARNEQAAIAADQRLRASIWGGAPWYEVPHGVTPAQAMLQAARDEAPRKRSMVEDLLDRRDTMVFHRMQGDES